ncbi:MAG: hypothetical protein M3Y17_15075 [Actinomycetota bacterium]|nr:hypothetical protein [Actinomycetota bacterium]
MHRARGGFYHEDDLYYVGFTRDVDQNIARLSTAFPKVQLEGFLVRHTWYELQKIRHEVTDAMVDDGSGQLLSVGPDVARNAVEVGVADSASPEAQSVAAQFGDAVHVFGTQPIELLGHAVPERIDTARSAHGELDVKM